MQGLRGSGRGKVLLEHKIYGCHISVELKIRRCYRLLKLFENFLPFFQEGFCKLPPDQQPFLAKLSALWTVERARARSLGAFPLVLSSLGSMMSRLLDPVWTLAPSCRLWEELAAPPHFSRGRYTYCI